MPRGKKNHWGREQERGNLLLGLSALVGERKGSKSLARAEVKKRNENLKK